MNVRVLSTFLALSFALPVAMAERPALAQVSDADRNAARDLYNEGYSLQQSGHFTEALDRFTRSLSVFPAPTTAFRIAQCKASLGKLVEAAEDFRAVATAALPAGSPEAFVKAKQEAGAELQKLVPRIPKVKIDIAPAGVSGLVVMVDGVRMSTALVGVGRPIDPGTHTITASAPGYAQAQSQVEVHEKQTPMPEVTLTLQPGGGGTTYAPNGGGGTTYAPNGGGGYQGTSGYSPYNTWVPPRRHAEGPSNALMLGVDAAVSIPFGNMSGVPDNLTNTLGVGGAVGVDVALRLVRIMYLGVEAQGAFFGGNDTTSGGRTAGGFAFSLNAVLGFMSNPEGTGFYGEFGGGLRTISTHTDTTPVTAVNLVTGDVILGLGIQFKIGSFRFIPKIDLFVGPNNGNDWHGFFTIGIAGYWELPFGLRKHHPPAAAPDGSTTNPPATNEATPATTTTPAE